MVILKQIIKGDKCIVYDTYSSLLGGGKKNFLNALKVAYPDLPVMFKDQAFVDFLNLPAARPDCGKLLAARYLREKSVICNPCGKGVEAILKGANK